MPVQALFTTTSMTRSVARTATLRCESGCPSVPRAVKSTASASESTWTSGRTPATPLTSIRSVTRGETIFFLGELPAWEKLCVEHVESSLRLGRAPCWLEEFEARGLSRREDLGIA